MKLEQAFEVQAPIERVWEALIDLERVAPCLPGATITDHDEDGTYHGEFKVKLGPTTASYRGTVKIEEADEATHTATMRAKGTDKRGQGGANATIVNTLTSDGGTHARRGRHRLHDHRPARPLRPRRHDRGHLQPADARLLDLPAEPHRRRRARAERRGRDHGGRRGARGRRRRRPEPAPSAADAGVQRARRPDARTAPPPPAAGAAPSRSAASRCSSGRSWTGSSACSGGGAASLEGMAEGCDTGVCGADVPPLIGSILTGTGLTLDQAAAALERGESPPLTDVQRRMVEEHAAARL